MEAPDAMNNYDLARKIRKWSHFIESVMSLHDTFEQTKVFDSHALGLIMAAEESGTVDYMCEKMSEFYRNQVKIYAPSLIKIQYPVFIFMVAIAFFFNVNFFFIGVFVMCLMLFLIV